MLGKLYKAASDITTLDNSEKGWWHRSDISTSFLSCVVT